MGDGMQQPGTYIGNTTKRMLSSRIPQSMKWANIQSSVSCRKVEFKIKPEQTQYSNNTNKIVRFMIPNIDFLDFREGYLKFNVTITPGAGATYCRVQQGIWSIFDQLRVASASMDIEKILYLNLINCFMHEMLADPFVVASVDRVLFGVGTQTDRNTWSAAPKTYCIPIASGFLNSGLMPMAYIAGALWIEWYITDPTLCMETDGAAPTITVNFPEIVCMRCTPGREYCDMVRNKINKAGIAFGWKAWQAYQTTPTPSATFSFQIPHRTSSVDSIVNIMRNANQLQNMTINDRMLNWYFYNMSTYQLRWNGIIIPDEPIFCGNGALQPYIILLKWLGQWKATGVYHDVPNINELHWTVDRFCFINDLTTMADSKLFSPVSSSTIASTIQADIVLTQAPSQPVQIDSLVTYFNLAILGATGQFVKTF